MAATALKYVTLQDYLATEASAEEKHEYFDGQIVAMAGAREAHNRIVANIMREAGIFLKGKTCDVFPSDLRVATPSSNSYMYPDITIICGDMEKKDGEFDTCTNPSVIIEVMSETTRDRDMGYKFFYYQQIPSLKEYILVDSFNYYVAVIHRQKDDSWKFDTVTGIDASININSVGLSLNLGEIYYKVALTQG